jgi:hypothetical protein
MIRKLFADFVVVVALCAVVWGSAPVWAACDCPATIGGACVVKNILDEDNNKTGVDCVDYHICGRRWQSTLLPWLPSELIVCKCTVVYDYILWVQVPGSGRCPCYG